MFGFLFVLHLNLIQISLENLETNHIGAIFETLDLNRVLTLLVVTDTLGTFELGILRNSQIEPGPEFLNLRLGNDLSMLPAVKQIQTVVVEIFFEFH